MLPRYTHAIWIKLQQAKAKGAEFFFFYWCLCGYFMLLPLPFGHALDQVALFKASKPFYRAALLQGLNTGTSKRLKGLQYKKQVAKYKPNQQCSLYLNPSCCKCTTYKAAQGCNLFSPQQKPVLHFVKPTLFARFSFLCFYSKLALFQ